MAAWGVIALDAGVRRLWQKENLKTLNAKTAVKFLMLFKITEIGRDFVQGRVLQSVNKKNKRKVMSKMRKNFFSKKKQSKRS